MKKMIMFLSLLICSLLYARTPPCNVYVGADGNDNKGGSTWANRMSLLTWEADLEANSVSGDVYYVRGGTYAFTSDISAIARNAIATNVISVIGVKSTTIAEPPTFSDWAYGAERPVFNATQYDWWVGDYWKVCNIILNTTDAIGFRVGGWDVIYNVKAYNSSATGDRDAFQINAYATLIACEAISTNGYVIESLGVEITIYNCYIHDSNVGFLSGGNNVKFVNNIFDSCKETGINLLGGDHNLISGCVFYNCATALLATDSHENIILNNIFDGCAAEAAWTTEQKDNFVAYNLWDPSSTHTNLAFGPGDAETDAALNAPATGDFTLTSSSTAALDAAVKPSTNLGVTGTYKMNIGVDQDDNAVGGTTINYYPRALGTNGGKQ